MIKLPLNQNTYSGFVGTPLSFFVPQVLSSADALSVSIGQVEASALWSNNSLNLIVSKEPSPTNLARLTASAMSWTDFPMYQSGCWDWFNSQTQSVDNSKQFLDLLNNCSLESGRKSFKDDIKLAQRFHDLISFYICHKTELKWVSMAYTMTDYMKVMAELMMDLDTDFSLIERSDLDIIAFIERYQDILKNPDCPKPFIGTDDTISTALFRASQFLEDYAGLVSAVEPFATETDDSVERSLITKIKTGFSFIDSFGRLIGKAYLVAGGKEGQHHIKLLDGSEISAHSSTGARDYMEDSYYIAHYKLADGTEIKILAGADGAGGHDGGDVASSLFLQGVHSRVLSFIEQGMLPDVKKLFESGTLTLQAERAVRNQGRFDKNFRRILITTGVVAVIVDDNLLVASGGDGLLTLDRKNEEGLYETVGFTRVDSNVDNNGHPRIITRHADGPCHFYRCKLKEKDRIAIGSDGLFENLLGTEYKLAGSDGIRRVFNSPQANQRTFENLNLFYQFSDAGVWGDQKSMASILHDLAASNMTKGPLGGWFSSGRKFELGAILLTLPSDPDDDNIFSLVYEHGPSLIDDAISISGPTSPLIVPNVKDDYVIDYLVGDSANKSFLGGIMLKLFDGHQEFTVGAKSGRDGTPSIILKPKDLSLVFENQEFKIRKTEAENGTQVIIDNLNSTGELQIQGQSRDDRWSKLQSFSETVTSNTKLVIKNPHAILGIILPNGFSFYFDISG